MYALWVSGAVNTQGFVWKFCIRYISIFIHSLRGCTTGGGYATQVFVVVLVLRISSDN